MKTVHLIFNAHIDPVRLWPWQSGLDEVLATCRSACDRLDAHPDLTFTRGEAWVYDEIERIDPALFERIKRHIASGQWEVIGGWWIQPDCNQPSGFAMERQIQLGKEYFESRLGRFPRIAYNVDSFGHAANLPGLMRAHGQDRYVMMRPQPDEMALPRRYFRWRGYEDGPEVVTFRIAGTYTIGNDLGDDKVWNSIQDLPDGIDHTMLFAGFGDHGGGPTERQIQWFRDRQDSFDGLKIVFSTPTRFFDAIWDQRDHLPLVTGELQQHAVGCYSAYRPIKTGVRTAEHALHQAEVFAGREPAHVPADTRHKLTEAWRRVCFNHFHDTLGGTCLPTAYPQALAELGYACNVADQLLQEGLRRKLTQLPGDPMQRIVLYNASDQPYDGMVEFAPWLDWQEWKPDWGLIDESGNPVPFQLIAPEALLHNMANLLFPLAVGAGEMRVLRISFSGNQAAPSVIESATGELLRAVSGTELTPSRLSFGEGITLEMPKLLLYDDDTDTWSHGIDRYAEEPVAETIWSAPEVVDSGPLMASWMQNGTVGASTLRAEWRVCLAGIIELKLNVNWREEHKLLKLAQPIPGTVTARRDGVPGGWLERPFDGRELPLRDAVWIQTRDQSIDFAFGIAAPDVYGIDATSERVRLTLLRSAIMAHHLPHSGKSARRVFMDQGGHTFRFRFFAGRTLRRETIDQHAVQMQRPLVIAESTQGMTYRISEIVELEIASATD